MSEYEKSLREMYELGVAHGKELARKDMEIEQLQAEIKELNDEQKD